MEKLGEAGIRPIDVLAVLATALIFVFFVEPLGNNVWTEDQFDVVRFVFALVGAAFVQALFWSSAYSWTVETLGSEERAQWARALLVPAVAVAVGFALLPKHQDQDRMHEVFEAYTHRFPPDQLHDPYIKSLKDEFGTMCAIEGEETRDDGVWDPTGFCLQIDLQLPEGEQVIGGFREDVADDYPKPRECFGRSRWLCRD